MVSDVDADKLDQVLRDGRLILWTISLAGLFILGIWGILWVRRWGQHEGQTFLSPAEEIAAFRRLLDQGLLSQEEFDRVRARLEQSNGQTAAVPALPSAGPEGPEGTKLPTARVPDPPLSPEPHASETHSDHPLDG